MCVSEWQWTSCHYSTHSSASRVMSAATSSSSPLSEFERLLQQLEHWPNKRVIYDLTSIANRHTQLSGDVADIIVSRVLDVSALFLHSSTSSRVHSLTPSLTHSFTHSLIQHSLTYSHLNARCDMSLLICLSLCSPFY